MATTQNTFNGNGSNLGPFSFTFKWLESTDIKVSVGGVLKTAGTHYNLQALNYTTKTGGQVLFTAGNAPPAGTNNIRIYRDTDDEALSATFSSGSAIRAKDLNDNFTQNLYVTQEINNNSLNVDGSNPMVGNLDLNNFKAINSTAPSSGTDLANKTYVDDRVSASAVAGSPYFLQDGAGAVNRSWSSKLKDVVSVKDFGAVGDGVTNDTAAIQAAITSSPATCQLPNGVHRLASSLSVGGNRNLVGQSPAAKLEYTANTGHGISISSSNVWIRDLTLDMGYDARGLTGASHGIRSEDDSNVLLSNVTVLDFGSDGSSGGTGALFFKNASRPNLLRIEGCTFKAATTDTAAYGWIYESTDTSFVSNTYASNATYAHELKNDSRHNSIIGIIGESSQFALAYGQDTAGIDGSDYNVAGGIVSKACDGGWICGEGNYNLTYGLLYDPTSNPGSIQQAVCFVNATYNASFGVLSTGQPGYLASFKTGSVGNYVQAASMQTSSGGIAEFASGVTGNVIDVVHTGPRDTVFSVVVDNSGSGRSGVNANVVISHSTGEQYGSRSGRFIRSLAAISPTYLSSHLFRTEAQTNNLHAFATDGTSGNAAGFSHAVPGNGSRGGVWHILGASETADTWTLRGWGLGGLYIWSNTAYSPNLNNTINLGSAGRLWKEIFAGNAVINTSDERKKQDILPLDEAEVRVAKACKNLIRKFRWKDAVAEKGDEARIHFGVIAQDVIKAFQAEGLDPFKYGVVCYDKWDETPEEVDADGVVITQFSPAGDAYSIRYNELLAFIIAAL